VSRLLSGDSFGLLSGEALAQAKRYLAEAQQETRPLIQHSPVDLKTLDVNRAILLLAVDQPRESLQVLMDLTDANYDASIEGFRALAMARLGRKREALAVLTQAESAFGRTDLFSAIRANIDTHQPYATAPNMLLDDDPVLGIRHAFEAFSRAVERQNPSVTR
jgi:predicted Zn-dependent protease